ncbi:hypothetical protein AB0L75_01930 [Streptomyces sp. NPDC052101]|uniref:hypothetical protein n=1 Tax=Streptomyces sp. NPDC052101 TaxID=3155763 RepID=UPI003421E411
MGALSRRDAWGWAMPESVPVRCPACRREHVYTAPVYPCACGAPTALRLDPAAAPVVAEHRSWDDEWIPLRCAHCGRGNHWPHPELGCPCGTVLRIPVSGAPATGSGAPGAAPAPEPGATPGAASPPTPRPTSASAPQSTQTPASASASATASGTHGAPAAPAARPAFQPRTIRTARDAVTTAALYLRWLGYQDIRRADQRPPNGIGLAAHGLLAQVDPTVRPAAPRDVECLWLTAMTESAECVYFSLAGYTDDARSRADTLCVPLFVLDLTGTPRPVNAPAGELSADGA